MTYIRSSAFLKVEIEVVFYGHIMISNSILICLIAHSEECNELPSSKLSSG